MSSAFQSRFITCRREPANGTTPDCDPGEHRLFSFITQNWRAKPLVSYRVIVDLIGATTTQSGLKVLCELDDSNYPKGILVSNAEMASINIQRADFHGEWNYTIAPSNQNSKAINS